jgi:hypothetical protein
VTATYEQYIVAGEEQNWGSIPAHVRESGEDRLIVNLGL